MINGLKGGIFFDNPHPAGDDKLKELKNSCLDTEIILRIRGAVAPVVRSDENTSLTCRHGEVIHAADRTSGWSG
jgi:hypothetical protein